MEQPFVALDTAADVEQAFAASHDAPVVLFKHDPYCPISAAAHRELQQMQGEVPLVDVAHANNLAQDIARRTGVRHESPQVIVIRDGQARWSASHWDITQQKVADALREHSGDAPASAE